MRPSRPMNGVGLPASTCGTYERARPLKTTTTASVTNVSFRKRFPNAAAPKPITGSQVPMLTKTRPMCAARLASPKEPIAGPWPTA